MNHNELCEVAKKWLLRVNSQRGHACNFALSECRSGWGGEIPDAIGYRSVENRVTETVVVEVKVSRSDFLADAKKAHRADGKGMGMYRYFMCPEGMIDPKEVPPRWGLLWVNSRGHVKPMLGPVALSNNCGTFPAAAEPWKHQHDTEREMWLLVRVMGRINDPDKMKKTLNDASRENSRLKDKVEAQSDEIERLKNKLYGRN